MSLRYGNTITGSLSLEGAGAGQIRSATSTKADQHETEIEAWTRSTNSSLHCDPMRLQPARLEETTAPPAPPAPPARTGINNPAPPTCTTSADQHEPRPSHRFALISPRFRPVQRTKPKIDRHTSPYSAFRAQSDSYIRLQFKRS